MAVLNKKSNITWIMTSVLTLLVISCFAVYFYFSYPYNVSHPCNADFSETDTNFVSGSAQFTVESEESLEAMEVKEVEADTGTTDIGLPEEKTDVDNLAVLDKSTIEVKDINGGDIWALDRLRYSIIVKNTGGREAKGIEVCCPIPAGMGYVGDSAKHYNLDSDNKTFKDSFLSRGRIRILNQNGTEIKWEIDSLKVGEVKKLTFEVFVADYLTYGAQIKTDFYIQNGSTKITLNNPVINIKANVFETIVCMGDSLTALTGYPEIMDRLLEKEFPHAEFNTISSGVKSEMASQAIARFDKDIRIYNPDIIILGYGANDAGEETGYFRYYMDILVKQSLSTGAEVFVFGVGFIDTANTEWINKANYTVFNDILKNDICPKNGAVYIDLYSEMSKEPDRYFKSDGMHWNDEGTSLAANIITGALVDYMDKDGRITPTSFP